MCSIFESSQSNSLIIYQKNHLMACIWMKISIEFHLPHYEIAQRDHATLAATVITTVSVTILLVTLYIFFLP